MSRERNPEVDAVREIRLRNWARTNYVPQYQRRDTWHPIVLEEMRRRDVELEAAAAAELVAFRYVPLMPTEMRRADAPHQTLNDPKMLRNASREPVMPDLQLYVG